MTATAVLFSGGLDSAVLLARENEAAGPALPIHVRAGMAWEDGEAEAIARLLDAAPFLDRTRPLRTLGVDMRDVYPATHWAIVGRPPAYDTPDEDVYLDGRNIVLLSKAAILCARLGVGRLVLGPLAGNPFPDATNEFFSAMQQALSIGLDRPIEIEAPLAALHKEEVIRLGASLGVPFALTLSCMNPSGGRHCGLCSKCRERQQAFAAAGVDDPTDYAARFFKA